MKTEAQIKDLIRYIDGCHKVGIINEFTHLFTRKSIRWILGQTEDPPKFNNLEEFLKMCDEPESQIVGNIVKSTYDRLGPQSLEGDVLEDESRKELDRLRDMLKRAVKDGVKP